MENLAVANRVDSSCSDRLTPTNDSTTSGSSNSIPNYSFDINQQTTYFKCDDNGIEHKYYLDGGGELTRRPETISDYAMNCHNQKKDLQPPPLDYYKQYDCKKNSQYYPKDYEQNENVSESYARLNPTSSSSLVLSSRTDSGNNILPSYGSLAENRENMNSYLMSNNNNVIGGSMMMEDQQFGGDSSKYSLFTLEQVQCICEVLQQRGDIEKLAAFLWNLPSSELERSDEVILR